MGDTGKKESKTELYRYFDKDGVLLYVGISLSAVLRQSSHKLLSSWYDEAVTMTIERFETRSLALSAEKKAIMSEKPKHNVLHNKNDLTLHFEARADIERLRLFGRTVVYKPMYTAIEVADILFPDSKSTAKKKVLNLIHDNKIKAIVTYEIHKKDAHGNDITQRKYAITGWELIDFIESLEAGTVTL